MTSKHELREEINDLQLTVEYLEYQADPEVFGTKVDSLEAERDAFADVFESLADDVDALDSKVREAISDLRALPEVPLSELESSIEAVIRTLREAL